MKPVKQKTKTVAAWPGGGVVVIEAKTRQTHDTVTLSQHQKKAGWLRTLKFTALGGRKVMKQVEVNRKLTPEEGNAICQRVARAQDKARLLRQGRNPRQSLPLAVVQKLAQDIFPGGVKTEPEWLAAVARACGEAWPQEQLKAWIDAGRYADTAAFARAWLEQKHRPSSRTVVIDFFLVAHWPQISAPGKTALAAYELAQKVLGYDTAGEFEAFAKHLHRRGIRLSAPHRPRK